MDADEADAAAGWIDDNVRCPPPQLFGELQRDRLLALDPVRLLQCRCVKQTAAIGYRSAHDRPGIADQTVDQRDRRSGHEALDSRDEGRVDRHHDTELKVVQGGIRCPGCAGVPVCRHDHPLHAELSGARDADRCPARLEGAGRQDAVVLDE